MSNADNAELSCAGNEDSLASALQAVSQQGESQAAVLKEKQYVLHSLQATLTETVKSYEEVANNIKLKERQINSTTCEIEEIRSHNAAQTIQIQAILMDNMSFKHTIEEQEEKSRSLLTEYNTYRNKMDNYKVRVSEMESQSHIYKKLVEKRKEVKRLKQAREELRMDLQNPEGNAVRQAQRDTDHIKAKILSLKELVEEKKMLLEKEKEVHSQLRKDIEIHNRRCEAIVKRLRCQLNKAQSSHRQISSDIFHMENEVEQLKNQL
ncbi:coiled-coil domain-containing protein 122 [Astyanax mexicanus]|uniref:Coiled-coil domain containing 122 n=1 Tax=Astyanax mexicanus TaxID=7994 RepID=A0A8B9R865_ASTMX|nr:coiled-coil domain-containing protein 122 [Astyanax mexicanus]